MLLQVHDVSARPERDLRRARRRAARSISIKTRVEELYDQFWTRLEEQSFILFIGVGVIWITALVVPFVLGVSFTDRNFLPMSCRVRWDLHEYAHVGLVLSAMLWPKIKRHLLCYTGGPADAEPWRVALCKMAFGAAATFWLLLSIVRAINTADCPMTAGRLRIILLVCFYWIVPSLLLVVLVVGVTSMIILARCGLVPLPRSAKAAPDALVHQLPRMRFLPSIFNDSEEEGTFPSCCSLCLEEFDTEKSITVCPCGPHVFHTECLDSWFQHARSCPLCRADVVKMHEDTKIDRSTAAPSQASGHGSVSVVELAVLGGAEP